MGGIFSNVHVLTLNYQFCHITPLIENVSFTNDPQKFIKHSDLCKKNIYITVLKWVFLSTHYHPLFCFKPAFFSWPLFHRYIKNQKVSVYQSFPLTLLIILELSHLYSKHAFITFNKYLTRLGIKNHILSQIMRDFFSHVLPELLFNLNLFCKTCDCEPHNISTARRQQPYSWEKNPWKLNKTTLFWSTSLSINGKK